MSASRREFLKTATAVAGASFIPYWLPVDRTAAAESKSANDRLRAGCIGNGGMGSGDARAVRNFADIVAFCDVDRSHSERLHSDPKIGAGKGDIYDDYRKVLDRSDIDVVTISTPDHWHTKIAIDALRAGKDVYCQKPLTLTIDEGKLLCKVLNETGRVFQVGTQQRSDEKFQTAVALARAGRIGKIHRVTVAIGGAAQGSGFMKTQPPKELDWERWLGQTPKVDYIPERCHKNFRWWYEYSGGKMTDWGAHHVDIAQWALGFENTGPSTIEVLSCEHPQPLKNGWPTVDNAFNTAIRFNVRCQFPDGVEMFIRNEADDLGFTNGVMFEGDQGRYFVNRGKLTGAPVDALKDDPLPADALTALRKGKPKDSHMGNFIACVRDRGPTQSDVFSHHRNLSTCHLANIAMRLGRTLTWDPVSEQIVGDAEANAFLSRPQRQGYEVG
ncbi:MAG TPA: Gfo/Idh/MocA family oxidoreductase [Pirellulales bacterium]|nr:Gfo/Idh/MocA family oxidoreductase [Pirellulales bacterium]